MPPTEQTEIEVQLAEGHLRIIKLRTPDAGAVALAICHNELLILPEYLNHYREIGVRSFLIVDDHSDDGTFEYLLDQEDCAVFRPVPGSEYRNDKKKWRRTLLDLFCSERWVILADVDEHFVWSNQGSEDLSAFIERLEVRNERCVQSLMIDMYADAPLNEQFFSGSNKLKDAFPYFDDDAKAPFGYRLQPNSPSFSRKWKTPSLVYFGGMRERMFFADIDRIPGWKNRLLDRNASLAENQNPSQLRRIWLQIVRTLTYRHFFRNKFTVGKIGLVKWQKGLQFSGGPHSIDRSVRLSESTTALLHYKFAHGAERISYTADRGQHAMGSKLYKTMLSKAEMLEASPMAPHSRRYEGPRSLAALLREPDGPAGD